MSMLETSAGSSPRPASALLGLGEVREFDAKRVRTFWRHVERYDPNATVRAIGARRRLVVVSGWASETRILHDGRRQIFGFALPGDVVDIEPFSNIGTRALVALTRLEVIDAEAVRGGDGNRGFGASEEISRAVKQREDRLLDHMVRIGQLTARERVLNLLLELHDRLQAVGLARNGAFRLPVTQEIFADALGLSSVHINRTLQHLRRERLIETRAGAVTLPDREHLAALACYQPR